MADTDNTGIIEEDFEDTTDTTLWSSMAFDKLFTALRENQPEPKLKVAILELVRRGHKPRYIVEKVLEKVGAGPAARVRKVMESMRS
jgi:hypothetical protein